MRIEKLLEALQALPADAEVFVRMTDDDDEPMYTMVDAVTFDTSAGVMIEAGEEITFTRIGEEL